MYDTNIDRLSGKIANCQRRARTQKGLRLFSIFENQQRRKSRLTKIARARKQRTSSSDGHEGALSRGTSSAMVATPGAMHAEELFRENKNGENKNMLQKLLVPK